MKLVAFTGKMGSGKSTAIKLLSETHRVVNVKFADPLYEIQEHIYKIISPAYSRPDNFVKDRKLLQWIGTEWGRGTIRESIWVDLWKERVSEANYFNSGSNTILACDDVRFDNEAQKVKELGGVVISLVSSNIEGRNVITNGITGHQSEAGISGNLIDAIVINYGTIEELRANLYTTLETLDIL